MATLNGVWLLLGLLALTSTVHAVLSRRKAERNAPSWLLIVGVGLIVAALFPYISATDDVLRIDHDQRQQQIPGHSHKHQTDDLMRLYEAMETSIVCHVHAIVVSFTFVAIVVSFALAGVVRIAPSSAGRSPPSSLIPSQA